MAVIRRDEKEVQFKVVYCGPPLGGKTTNLQYVHRRLDPLWRGDMISVATEQNRTISFDYLPLQAMKIGDFQVRFQLYTVPGQEVMRDTRKAVLAGADAVIFVADSAPERLESNVAALADTRECLRENRIHPDAIPFVFQYNKRDLPGATFPEDLDDLLEVSTPSFLASAVSGYQIFATLDAVTQKILKGFELPPVEEETRGEWVRGQAPRESTVAISS
jgi:signal recognition particle receptor subunit beta